MKAVTPNHSFGRERRQRVSQLTWCVVRCFDCAAVSTQTFDASHDLCLIRKSL